MIESTGSLPRGLRIGSVLVIIAGLVPFTVASILFVYFLIGEHNPAEPWMAGQFPPGPGPYSLDDIRKCQPELATAFVTAQHIEFANVMNTGSIIVILAIFGLRRFQKWSWYVILAVMLWVGLNDALALLKAHNPPIPLLPEIIGFIGLMVARPSVLGSRKPDR